MEAGMMYWHKLDERNRRSLACDIYLGALSVTDTDGAKIVCRDTLERAGARAGEAEQLAQQTHEWYLHTSADIEAGKYGR